MSRPDWIYDENGKIIGYKTPEGADSVFPFTNIKKAHGNVEYILI